MLVLKGRRGQRQERRQEGRDALTMSQGPAGTLHTPLGAHRINEEKGVGLLFTTQCG